MTVLCRAAMCGNLKIFKQILSYGCDLNTESYIFHDKERFYLASPLHVAAAYNRQEIVKYILQKQGNKFVNAKCTSAPAQFEAECS